MGSFGETRLGGFVVGLLALCGVMVAAGYLHAVRLGDRGRLSPDGRPGEAGASRIPALKIRAPIKPIEVNDQQVLDPPRNPREVGWWKRSVRPGATHGQTVLTGHTVHTGGGVMDNLGKLHKGQLVKVVTRKGTMVYRTTKVVTWSKSELAKRAVDLFAQKREDERLVLITCSGWTGKSYTSNIVVFADPLGVPDKKKQKKNSAEPDSVRRLDPSTWDRAAGESGIRAAISPMPASISRGATRFSTSPRRPATVEMVTGRSSSARTTSAAACSGDFAGALR